MCTIEEIRDLIHEELFNPKEDGKSRLSQEIETHIEAKLNDLFWRLIKWIGGAGVTVVIMSTAAWVNMANEVKQNTDFRHSGEILTEQDGALLQQQINDLNREQASFEAWMIRIEAKLDQALNE